ncbi:hypothetical protein [Paenibacillus sp. S150]|uniref:hypothetical protein n=1 Tax=Paenibacillus sp. S150 TaxID=2749826 RepID=UPI001C56581F|nr:hypothetical protein [Paenibacillus sp. S150]MBW4082692.1 hypothetical protein [Paenibacillus sp. S150]
MKLQPQWKTAVTLSLMVLGSRSRRPPSGVHPTQLPPEKPGMPIRSAPGRADK